MAPNPFFSGRIPKDLHERVEAYLAETKGSKTQLLINALATYLNHPVQTTNPTSSPIEAKIVELEQRLTVLGRLEEEVADLRRLVTGKINASDNKSDNNPDQLSFLESDNASDNIPDNNFYKAIDNESSAEETSLESDNIPDKNPDNNLSKAIDNTGNKADSSPSEEEVSLDARWIDLGEMRVSEIVKLEKLRHWDVGKLKQKLRNINQSKSKMTEIGLYRFRIIGKEPGGRGQFIFAVEYRQPQVSKI